MRLLELRKKKGYSQKLVAELCGFQCTVYQRWENGERDPQLKNAIVLANFFEVSLDYLAGLTDNPKRN